MMGDHNNRTLRPLPNKILSVRQTPLCKCFEGTAMPAKPKPEEFNLKDKSMTNAP
jgi:hypothetical protein